MQKTRFNCIWKWYEDPIIRRHREGWINAGHVVAQDRSARRVCPTCGRGVLEVWDEPIGNGERVERWMRCNSCGLTNTLLMSLEQVSGTIPNRIDENVEDDKEVDTKEIDLSNPSAVTDLIKRAVVSIRKK